MPEPRTITRIARPAALALAWLLSGCLFTEEPVFDAASSTAGTDSPELAAWIAHAETFPWTDDPDQKRAPVPFRQEEEQDQGELRVAAILEDGAIVVQEYVSACPEGYCAAYYALRTRPDGTPEICWANTYRQAEFDAAALEAGVVLSRMETSGDKVTLPPDVAVEGPAPAVRAFLIGRFAEGPVFCEAPPFGDEIPSPPSP